MNISFQGFKITGNQLVYGAIVLLLVLYILKLKECSPAPTQTALKGKDSISYIYKDTGSVKLVAEKTIYRDTGSIKFITQYLPTKLTKSDTDRILADYLKPYLIEQSFSGDNYKAKLTGAIGYDSLYNAKLYVQNLTPTEVINNTTVTNPIKNKIFLGLITGYMNGFVFAPKIDLLTKKYTLISISHNLIGSQNNGLISVGWKLHISNPF